MLPGGHDWNIVVGAPVGTPARAGGALPQRQLADQEVTAGVWAREQVGLVRQLVAQLTLMSVDKLN